MNTPWSSFRATGNSGGIQVLGTIYRATLEDSKWTCVQPGLVAPETPVIQSANPQNNGATLVLSPDADQVIEQYTVQLSKPGTSTEFEVPIAGGGTGTLTVEERSSERTVLSFVGSGITNGQTWTVKVKAENGNGANVSDFSNSVEFIPGADTVNLDFSPQFNAKITRNSAGQACNFDYPDRCFVSEQRCLVTQDVPVKKDFPTMVNLQRPRITQRLNSPRSTAGAMMLGRRRTAGSTPFAVEPAGKYSSIHLVATSGGSAGKKARFRVEMQYDDGTRVTSQEYDVPDWFASPTAPVYVVKGSMDRYRGDNTPGYSDEGKAAIFGVGIATDSSKTLSSIAVEIIEIPDTFALLGGAATTKSFESVTSPPGAPTGVSAIGLNKSASVSFTPPTSNGGATITGYTVTSLPDSKTCTTSDAGSLTCDVTDLTNGTAYTFTVTATNALGTSAASAPSNSVTPAAPASTPECSDESIDWTTAATEEGWSCTVDGTAYEYSTFLVFTANVAPDSGLPRLKWDYAPTKPSEAAGTAEEQTDGSWIYRVPGGMAINVTDGASQWTDVLQWGNSTVGDASFGSGRALGDGEGFGSLGKISATDKPTLASNLEALFSGAATVYRRGC